MNRFPGRIQAFKPAIGSCLIADLTPEAFLQVQAGLVRWQILQAQPDMCLKKEFHLFSSMPAGSIDIQPDRIPFEPLIEMLEAAQESFSIPLRQPHEALSTQERGHPAEDIEPLAMLAGGRDAKPFPSLGPTDSQTRMGRETGFVLKDEGLRGSQGPQFFLTICGTACFLRPGPGGRNSWLASVDTLIGASNIGPDGPSVGCQSGA